MTQKTYRFNSQRPRSYPRPPLPEPVPEVAPAYQKEVPDIETKVSLSKDGEWVITKVTITTIKHRNYYAAILSNNDEEIQQ